jgi:hypothetical protein
VAISKRGVTIASILSEPVSQIIGHDTPPNARESAGSGMPLSIGGNMKRYITFPGNADTAEATGAVFNKRSTLGSSSHFANIGKVVGMNRHGVAEMLFCSNGP